MTRKTVRDQCTFARVCPCLPVFARGGGAMLQTPGFLYIQNHKSMWTDKCVD